MPGSMIHLIVANKVRPNASDLFYLGNIAPDTVNDWRMKKCFSSHPLGERCLEQYG